MAQRSLKSIKGGGTSVQSGRHIRHFIRNVIHAVESRRGVTVSAPAGVTDKLDAWITPYGWHAASEEVRVLHQRYPSKDDIMMDVRGLFASIVDEVGISLDVAGAFDAIRNECGHLKSTGNAAALRDFAITRGEQLNAEIVAKAAGFHLVNATELIVLNEKGQWEEGATRALATRMNLRQLSEEGFVIGGFHGRSGADPDRVVAFSRGGSDITGAIIAKLISASEYENWTDVEGVLTADPRIVMNARKILRMSFDELLELAYTGAKVFHPSAVRPVAEAGIPVHIRCTATPNVEGTWILPYLEPVPGSITGVAHRDGFSMLRIRKIGMNDERGFDALLNGVLLGMKMSFHHKPTGIDSMAVVLPTAEVNSRKHELQQALRAKCGIDEVHIEDGFTMICTVGAGIVNDPSVLAKFFGALNIANVKTSIIDKGGSDMNMIIGVRESQSREAIVAIHDAFLC